jgi:hypothetical protein
VDRHEGPGKQRFLHPVGTGAYVITQLKLLFQTVSLGTWVNNALLRFCNLRPCGRRRGRPRARGVVGPQPHVAEVEYGGLVLRKLHVVEREREARGVGATWYMTRPFVLTPGFAAPEVRLS